MADIKNIDVFQTVTSVSFEVEPNTNIININKVTTSGYSGVPNLQQVTDIGANTTNGINIDTEDTYEIGLYAISSNIGIKGESRESYGVYGNSTAAGVYGNSDGGYGVQGYSESGVAVYGSSQNQIGIQGNSVLGTAISAYSDYGTGLFSASESNVGVSAFSNSIGLEVNGNGTIAIEANLGNSNKGLVINSGTSSTGNFIELDKNGVDKLVVNQAGELTATKLIKQGGSPTEFLMADGSVSTGGGGGGATNLSPSQTATNFTINSDTGTDAIVPLGNGILAGATLNDYTTPEKTKLAGITGTNTGDQNLQSVTNLGATTTNPITSGTVTASSINDYGISAISTNSDGVIAESTNGNGIVGVSQNLVGGVFMTVNGANIAEFKTNFVTKTFINSDGELTAQKLIKDGGDSSQILAANGDTITAGTNITISGGTISSTGGAGGSSSVNFYLNGSIASNVAGYQQIGATAVIGAGTDFSLVGNGTIAQFLTDVGSPNRLEIPSGAWNFELWLQSSINNSGTNVHIELYKYDGAFTLIATGVSNPISLQTNTTTNLYVTNVAIPQTTLLATDRLAIRVIASNAVGLHSVTLHTEDSNLCEVITNFVGGVTAINGITQPSQTLATGTTGTDFAVVSSGSTHTFNLPSASASARGVITTEAQTIAGDKTFTGTTAGITKSMVGLSNVDNTSDATKPISTATQTALNLKVDSNTAITGSTKTKITYDVKGLVTAGADATTADIPDSTNKRYVTDENLTVIGNTSGTNTGDNATNTQYSGLATSKQDTLQSTVNIKSINGNSILGSGDLTISASPSSQSAFTILANNTNASAVPTERPFENITNDVYSGTIVWTGGAAPTVPNHTYSLSQIGNLVTLTINLAYTTAGSSLLTGVAMELPSTAPAPALPSSATAALDVINYGSGALQILNDSPSTAFATNTLLRIKSTGVYEVFVTRAAAQYRHAYATIQYFV